MGQVPGSLPCHGREIIEDAVAGRRPPSGASERVILDASALIAYVNGEPGWERVEAAIEDDGRISAVNFSEVAARLARGDRAVVEVTDDLADLGLVVEAFGALDARLAAELIPATRAHGLSLADRACLALARRTGHGAITCDRVWADVEVGVEITLAR